MGHFLALAGRVFLVWVLALSANIAFYAVVTGAVAGAFRFFWAKGLKRYKIQQR